jgi:hypothetical protein
MEKHMNDTLTLKKTSEVRQKPNGPGAAHLHHWNGRKVVLTLTTGEKVSGRMESIAKYDVLMKVNDCKVIVHKQHIVMCKLP